MTPIENGALTAKRDALRSEGNAYDYRQLLLKSMRLLQEESKDFNMYATFVGDKEYQSVRQRVKRIAA